MNQLLPPNPAISSLDGSPAKGISILGLFLLFVAVLLSGILKIILLILGIFVLFFALTNLYFRLKNKWSRLHYPLSYHYSFFIGAAVGANPDNPLDENKKIALLGLTRKLFPSLSDEDAKESVKQILSENYFQDYDLLEKVFTLQGIDSEKARAVSKEVIAMSNNDGNFIVPNYYAHVINSKFGRDVLHEYIFAIITNRAV